MSLGGLALATGLVVDDSIVVLESIAKARERGLGILEAAIAGTREVSMAVVASTLTTIAVFLPLVFVQGVAGQLFRDQALTVAIAIADLAGRVDDADPDAERRCKGRPPMAFPEEAPHPRLAADIDAGRSRVAAVGRGIGVGFARSRSSASPGWSCAIWRGLVAVVGPVHAQGQRHRDGAVRARRARLPAAAAERAAQPVAGARLRRGRRSR